MAHKLPYTIISPFRYKNAGIQIESFAEDDNFKLFMKIGISEGKITNAHLEVAELLLKYKYLTRRQIENILPKTSVINENVVSMATILSYMVNAGLINRCYLDFLNEKNGSFKSEGGNDSESLDVISFNKRTVNFYMLTSNMIEYFHDKYKNEEKQFSFGPSLAALDDILQIYEHLSANQFLTMCAKYKGMTIRLYEYVPQVSFTIPGIINKENVIYFVLSARQNSGWRERLCERIAALNKYVVAQVKSGDIVKSYNVLIVCENDIHVSDAYCELKPLPYNFKYLFTTELRLYDNIFSYSLLFPSYEAGRVLLKEIHSPLL